MFLPPQDLTEEARHSAQQKLTEIEQAMTHKQQTEKAKKVDDKYKNIKFFGKRNERNEKRVMHKERSQQSLTIPCTPPSLLTERKKLLRRRQQLQKKLSTMFVRQPGAHVDKEEKQLRQEIAAVQQDMDYIDVSGTGQDCCTRGAL